jgi:glycosyltransferase involved in cell wall biosynthesis
LRHELGIPFVQVIHNTYMWFDDAQREAFAHAARFTTAFVAVSEYAKRYSVRRLGIDETRCIVIPNGIDGAAFDAFDKTEARREIRAKHGLADEDFVFLSVGSINHQKNHIATVRAFSTVAEEMPHAKLMILGPTYEKNLLEEIERFIAERGLGERVIYAGSAPSAEKYFAMADAFVSAAFFEGGGLNHIEAARANLPSIMTNVGYACDFAGAPGFEIVNAPHPITEFRDPIWKLTSTPAFEEYLAVAMVRTFRSRRRPDLAPEVLDAFDKTYAYQCYVELIGDLLQGKDVRSKIFTSSWPNRLAAVQSEYSRATA